MAAVFIVNSSIFTLSFAFFVTQTCAKHENRAETRFRSCIGWTNIVTYYAGKRLFSDASKRPESTVWALGFLVGFTPIYHIIPAVILSFFCRLFFSLWSPTIPVGCFIWGCPVLFCMLTLWVAVCVLPLYVPSWLLRISPFWSFGKGVGGRVRSRKFRCCNSACGVNQMKKGRNPRWISAWKVCAFSVFR